MFWVKLHKTKIGEKLEIKELTICAVPWLDRGRLGEEQHGVVAGEVLLVDPTIQRTIRVFNRNSVARNCAQLCGIASNCAELRATVRKCAQEVSYCASLRGNYRSRNCAQENFTC